MRAENHTQVRAPLDQAALRRALARPGGLWRDPEVVESTGSTNADLLARALAGEPEGAVLAAEEQRAGRGRMGRTWTSPPRAALTVSVLLKPAVPPARRGWLPLLAGVAVATAVTRGDRRRNQAQMAERPPGGRRQAGRHPGRGGRRRDRRRHRPQRVHRTRRVPCPPAPARCPPPRCARPARPRWTAQELLLAILAELEHWYRAWQQAGGDPDRSGLRQEYLRWSATIGRTVRAELPGGQALSGPAVGVDSDGRLLVRVSSGSEVAVAAGDVVHLR